MKYHYVKRRVIENVTVYVWMATLLAFFALWGSGYLD